MDAASMPDLLGYRGLATLGLTRRQFDQRIEAGEYERIAPGLCLISALSIHDLTDEIPNRSDIAIPRGVHAPTITSAPISWHRFDAATFIIGRTEYALPGGLSIGLYSAERTIIDLFRLSHDWGSDLAIEALKRWLHRRGNSPSALLAQVRDFPKGRPALQNALEILL